MLVGLALSLCSALELALVMVASYLADRRRREKAEVKFVSLKAAWDMAIVRWGNLYYCHADGIVFDPETYEYCLPQEYLRLVTRSQSYVK